MGAIHKIGILFEWTAVKTLFSEMINDVILSAVHFTIYSVLIRQKQLINTVLVFDLMKSSNE
jgi:hypothetical protein